MEHTQNIYGVKITKRPVPVAELARAMGIGYQKAYWRLVNKKEDAVEAYAELLRAKLTTHQGIQKTVTEIEKLTQQIGG